MRHEGKYQYGIEFRYADATWANTIWADDDADAERKLRALQTNGRVVGRIYAHISLPNWFGRLLIKLGLATNKEQ